MFKVSLKFKLFMIIFLKNKYCYIYRRKNKQTNKNNDCSYEKTPSIIIKSN